jgi:hypothetical protein
MIELEMTKANLESLGLTTAANQLDAFLERARGENYT